MKVMEYRSAQNTAIPSCRQDGSYKPTQCISISIYIPNDSSECWCVTVDGNEVPGTRKKMSKGNLDCEGKLLRKLFQNIDDFILVRMPLLPYLWIKAKATA